ncbi:MAG: OsmC family protein [Steroidobacteraceae bacterium]
MKIQRSASALWKGGIKDGKGEISTGSGALAAYPYGFASRFEGVAGTNPEELLAAAHAGCFTMALSLMLTEAGLVPAELATKADVTLEKMESGFQITTVKLTLTAKVPGASAQQFQDLANKAKLNCPLSKVLRADISLVATLA